MCPAGPGEWHRTRPRDGLGSDMPSSMVSRSDVPPPIRSGCCCWPPVTPRSQDVHLCSTSTHQPDNTERDRAVHRPQSTWHVLDEMLIDLDVFDTRVSVQHPGPMPDLRSSAVDAPAPPGGSGILSIVPSMTVGNVHKLAIAVYHVTMAMPRVFSRPRSSSADVPVPIARPMAARRQRSPLFPIPLQDAWPVACSSC